MIPVRFGRAPDDLAGMYMVSVFTRKKRPEGINQLPERVQSLIRHHLLSDVVTEVYIIPTLAGYTIALRWYLVWGVMIDDIIFTCNGPDYDRLETERGTILATCHVGRDNYCVNIALAYLSTCAIPPGMVGDMVSIISNHVRIILSINESHGRPLPASHFVHR